MGWGIIATAMKVRGGEARGHRLCAAVARRRTGAESRLRTRAPVPPPLHVPLLSLLPALPLLDATKAFGMGIDEKDVRCRCTPPRPTAYPLSFVCPHRLTKRPASRSTRLTSQPAIFSITGMLRSRLTGYVPVIASLLFGASAYAGPPPQGVVLGNNPVFWLENPGAYNEMRITAIPACSSSVGGFDVFWSNNLDIYGGAAGLTSLNYSSVNGVPTDLPNISQGLVATGVTQKLQFVTGFEQYIYVNGTPPCTSGTAAPRYVPDGYGDSQIARIGTTAFMHLNALDEKFANPLKACNADNVLAVNGGNTNWPG